jgi:hypothetical protein
VIVRKDILDLIEDDIHLDIMNIVESYVEDMNNRYDYYEGTYSLEEYFPEEVELNLVGSLR